MISVIIPTLNEESTIKNTLMKLDRSLEIIVVDGGSNDRTVEIAKKYAKVVGSEKNRGIQMNRGVEVATNKILLFLHADTKLPENWENEVKETIKQGYSGGVFRHSFDKKTKMLKFGSFLVNLNFSSFSWGDRGIFVRKDMFDKLNGYKEIPIMEDIDFVKRLNKFGKIKYMKSKVVTSARRFLKKGVLKQLSLDFLLIFLYFLNISPYKLIKLYKVIR